MSIRSLVENAILDIAFRKNINESVTEAQIIKRIDSLSPQLISGVSISNYKSVGPALKSLKK